MTRSDLFVSESRNIAGRLVGSNPSSYGGWERGDVSGTGAGWDRKQKT